MNHLKLMYAVGMGVLLSGAALTVRADVVDGGFETPASTTPDEFNAGNLSFPVGSSFGGPGGTAWTVVGDSSNSVALTSTTQYFFDGPIKEYYNANSGLQWLDLTGTSDNGARTGVQQTVATILSQTYTVSFYVGYQSFNNNPASTELDVNGTDVGTFSNFTPSTFPSYNGDGVAAQTWQLSTYTFTATSTSTTLAFYNLSPSGNSVNGLDDVSLTAVPEPASLGLLGLGAVGLLSRRRRV